MAANDHYEPRAAAERTQRRIQEVWIQQTRPCV